MEKSLAEEVKYINPKIYKVAGSVPGYDVWCFTCPGCEYDHAFDTRWTWNGSVEAPTFKPSLLCNESDPRARCHSFVENGNIRFLEDCFHALKGKTVPLPDVER